MEADAQLDAWMEERITEGMGPSVATEIALRLLGLEVSEMLVSTPHRHVGRSTAFDLLAEGADSQISVLPGTYALFVACQPSLIALWRKLPAMNTEQ